MNQPIRTIHVGSGGRGRTHLHNASEDKRFKPVACADVLSASLDNAVESYGIALEACFSSLGEAVQRVEADVAVISTPVVFHGEQIEEALAAGLHVMVEKPFTIDLAQAERLVAAAAARGLKIMVTQNMRYIPAFYTMARLVHEQAYGPPGYFSFLFHKHRRRPYNDSPHQQLWQMTVHEMDVVRSVLGAEPRRVHCREMMPPWTAYPTPPSAVIMLEFDGLCGVSMSSSDSATLACELRVECAEGALINRTYRGPLFHALAREEKQLELDELPGGFDDEKLMLHLFHQYVVHNIEPDISGRHNLGTMRLMDACIRSSETREAVEL